MTLIAHAGSARRSARGGLLGNVLAQGLRAALNPLGANSGFTSATLLTALFLTTSFSLSRRGRVDEEAYDRPKACSGKWMARVKDWREERESERLRKQVEEIKIAGRPAGGAAARFGTARKSTSEEDEQETAPKRLNDKLVRWASADRA